MLSFCVQLVSLPHLLGLVPSLHTLLRNVCTLSFIFLLVFLPEFDFSCNSILTVFPLSSPFQAMLLFLLAFSCSEAMFTSQQAYVKASNTDAEDRFGSSLALSADGNTMAVGADTEGSSATGINGNQADNSANSAGAVYVFIRTDGTWIQQA